ncbi:glycosidase [Sphingobacterium sp. DK4209]|uniref:Glycosidase n=1 Tax=Sphingobacterium zhuxiongii TaxID=2662364 RepID=A0A5Q0QBS1_9SPHI|nr:MULTISPECIES: glycoside hydrolase family 130 protein [unclassified Sphingobacterium]MVZ67349.1 glycosidase [Sphingobacterium sp. DK4209]QGA26936.1 glycosidase [Sphingobacterium sp. dk4302]
MGIVVNRKNIFFKPKLDRVLARKFVLSQERTIKIVQRVLKMSSAQKVGLITQILRNYAGRHRSILNILERNFLVAESALKVLNIQVQQLSEDDRMLIGSFFTMEYSIEAAAYFNPSIVISPDQSQTLEGEKRIILSFRAVGEGHLSSIVFCSALIDNHNDIHIDAVGTLLDKPKQIKNHIYKKDDFLNKLRELQQADDYFYKIVDVKLTNSFTYDELQRFVREIKAEEDLNHEANILMQQMLWLASSHYEIAYSHDTLISERVIFPISDTEKNGIEDARFVRFVSEKGTVTYYATYTAYDGHSVLPKLLSTKDFVHFKVQPLNGKIVNKGAALFPRKINGSYAMLCRVDGENSYIVFSKSVTDWHSDITLIAEPEFPWEFIQVGNCGSPIETSEGWLVITHSVGPMREYAIGAMLLDLDNPTHVIGKLKRPLLWANEEERNGYVPNVVYSCGQIIHNGELILPYAYSDQESTYATINLKELLSELIESMT